jgi:hypothetical protein
MGQALVELVQPAHVVGVRMRGDGEDGPPGARCVPLERRPQRSDAVACVDDEVGVATPHVEGVRLQEDVDVRLPQPHDPVPERLGREPVACDGQRQGQVPCR